MSNADCEAAFLRGDIDVNHYWRESGEQQIKSAGVLLTENQAQRALKNLARLASSLRKIGVHQLTHPAFDPHDGVFGADYAKLKLDFDRYLATYK